VLSQKVVGQPAAMRVIVPYIQMYQAGLAPEGPSGRVFPVVRRPTGTGKTKTVEALADVLHAAKKTCSRWIAASSNWNMRSPSSSARRRATWATAKPSPCSRSRS